MLVVLLLLPIYLSNSVNSHHNDPHRLLIETYSLEELIKDIQQRVVVS